MNDHRPPRGNPLREQNPAYGLLLPIYKGEPLAPVWEEMNYAVAWNGAVRSVREEYDALQPLLREEVVRLCRTIAAQKEALHAVVREAGGEEICRDCAGECCRSGKYHVSVADLLGFLAADEPLFIPRFDGPGCPYLGDAGCLMSPGFRPFPCVTFACDRLHHHLSEDEADVLLRGEETLRGLSAELATLLGHRVSAPLLHCYEEREKIIFGRNHGDRDR